MKIKEYQNMLKKKKVDLALFYNVDFEKIEKNILYFSGYAGLGILAIPSKRPPFLIVPKMELKRAKEGTIRKIYRWNKEKRLFENAKFILKNMKIRRIAIDKTFFSLAAYKELKKQFKKTKFVDVSKEAAGLREIKTKQELKIIKEGCKISDKILENCIRNFKRFKTEAEVKAFLEYEAKKIGCDLAFPTIVASGKNAVKAHHDTKNVKLNKGFCVIDFGIRYKNYCTDTTRTIYNGKATKEEKDIYNFVLAAQREIIKNLKIKKKCSAIYKEAKNLLGKYGQYFNHGLGHGFGINIHELPNLSEKSKDRIKNNMVFTIEPGIYFKNIGIRIEDDILIENNKINVLTKIKKELIEV